MIRYKILIVPGGTDMAVSAILSLSKHEDVYIITGNDEKLSAGGRLSDKQYDIPISSYKEMYKNLKELTKLEKDIDVIIPASHRVTKLFSENRKEIEELGPKVVVSDDDTVKVTLDKWKTYEIFKDLMPISYIDINHDFEYPLFIKPRFLSGSVKSFKINNYKELQFFFEWIDEPIIQDYLGGTEYTIDCLADMKGNLLIAVPRQRYMIKDGVTRIGKVVNNIELFKMAKAISNTLKFKGPFFFQAKENSKGIPLLTEIDCRIGGGMYISSICGADIYMNMIRLAMNENVSVNEIRNDITVTRYLENIIIDDEI